MELDPSEVLELIAQEQPLLVENAMLKLAYKKAQERIQELEAPKASELEQQLPLQGDAEG